MDKLFLAFAEYFPTLIIIIGFIIAVFLSISQYLKIVSGIDKKVSESVSARIGEILGGLQVQIAEAEQFSKSQEKKLINISEIHDKILAEIESRNQSVIQQFSSLEKRFSQIFTSLPEVEDYSADDLLSRAARSEGLEQAQYCSLILQHEDASAQILEHAGDLMRSSKRYSLSKDLYEKSFQKDPERSGAYVEYVSLKIELYPTGRDELLDEAMEKVLDAPDPNEFVRLANTIIRLQRFSTLLEFSERVHERVKGVDRKFESLTLRNMGTANKRLRNKSESEKNFYDSFCLTPDSEDAVRMHAQSLEDSGNFSDYISLRKQLLLMDPTDFNYYTALISSLLKSKDFLEAKSWLQLARSIAMNDAQSYQLDKLETKIVAGLAVAGLVE